MRVGAARIRRVGFRGRWSGLAYSRRAAKGANALKPAILGTFLLSAMVAAWPAFALTAKCPPPGAFKNGQVLADGWQIAIEDRSEARVEEWANGVAFFLPAASGQAAVTELQCISRLRQESDGKVVQVEARKPLDAHYRCKFSKSSYSFDCKR